MPGFEAGTVVKVPFPYTNRPTCQARTALVVSTGHAEAGFGLLWVLMITSAANRGWPGDVDIPGLASAGLPAPSIVRSAKIATIEAADATVLGQLDAATLAAVTEHLRARLGL
jgi:mRNA interferase MazF